MLKLKKMTKKQKRDMLMRVLKVILGTLILAFGQAVFIEQYNLVIGGVASIGNIIKVFIDTEYTVRVTVVILEVLCFVIGYLFLGKRFSAQTLISTIVYIVAYPLISTLAKMFIPLMTSGDSNVILLLAGVFGGMISGLGIALCLLGGGSTGGVDVFAILLAKATHTKAPIWMFIVDAVVVFLGYILIDSDGNNLMYCLICILAALCSSLTTEVIISKQNNSFVVNIVSSKWEEINEFILKDLDRGSTLIDVIGGYTMENRRMIQAAISRDQYSLLISKISEVDKDAFVTINGAHEVNGEGFEALPSSARRKRDK